MLLVVLGHCYMSLDDPINRFILSFHMPVFFFLSGMCAKLPNGTFSTWASKKAHSLLVPQLTLAAIVFIYAAVSHGANAGTLIDSLLVWFLPSLYICTLLFWWLARLAERSAKAWAFALCAVAASAPLAGLLDIDVCPIRPETVLASLFFFCLGHGYRRCREGECARAYSSYGFPCVHIFIEWINFSFLCVDRQSNIFVPRFQFKSSPARNFLQELSVGIYIGAIGVKI